LDVQGKKGIRLRFVNSMGYYLYVLIIIIDS